MVVIKSILLSVLCVGCVLQAGHSVSAQRAKFCGKYDCPPFKVLNKTADYELRLYEASQWVSNSKDTDSPFSYPVSMFWNLFWYIMGMNKGGKTMSWALPGLMKITLPTEIGQKWNIGMCFYLKSNSNPEPNNKKVFLIKQPATKIYVRSFPGFAKAKDWSEHIKVLMNALPEGSYEGSYFYTAGYNSPFQRTNRHNEVWLVAKN